MEYLLAELTFFNHKILTFYRVSSQKGKRKKEGGGEGVRRCMGVRQNTQNSVGLLPGIILSLLGYIPLSFLPSSLPFSST
jgi:hypothetical protein